MIATEVIDLKNGATHTLAPNVTSLVLAIEVHANPNAEIHFETSHDGVTWFDAMSPLVGDSSQPTKLISFDSQAENLLQHVRVQIFLNGTQSNAISAGIAEIKLFFGRR